MQASRVTLGVLRELREGESRVALVPADIKRLCGRAHVYVQRGAGGLAGMTDQEYVAAGAHVVTAREVFAHADVLLGVRPPEVAESLRSQTVLISLGGHDPHIAEMLRKRSVIHLALERLPRITRAQSMDVLSSQASIAGYAAVIEGARRLKTLLPMMVTAAGTAKPAKMMAIGAGVAGLQALATARRLGARTFAFDVREAAREQVESIGARFVTLEQPLPKVEGAGGYAADQTIDQQRAIRSALMKHLAPMQLIVMSAQIPGRSAPILIDEPVARQLQPGTVIVDLAAESGGNTVYTKPDETVHIHGVQFLGPTNLPSTIAQDASRFFSANLRALLEHILGKEGRLDLDENDAIVSALLANQRRVPEHRSFVA